MRSLLRYPGAKWRLAEQIISRFPTGYQEMVYLEPFAGSLAVFFNKQPSKVETVNDLDGKVVNLFRVLRAQGEALSQQLALTPYSREEYELSYTPCDDQLESARRFMVRTCQAIGAKTCRRCGWRNHKVTDNVGGTALQWSGLRDVLPVAIKRLRGNAHNLVQIEHTDALRLIERYNSSNVLMYLDPPYVHATRKEQKLYQYEMDEAQHQKLLSLVSSSKAKIVLSGYPSALYDSCLHDWYKAEIQTYTTAGEISTEAIWQNYEPDGQLRLCV